MSKNVTSTSKKAVSFDYLKGRFSVKIILLPSKLAEKLCDSWVLNTSVGGTGSFSAPTVTYSISESAHVTQNFSANLLETKIITDPLPSKQPKISSWQQKTIVLYFHVNKEQMLWTEQNIINFMHFREPSAGARRYAIYVVILCEQYTENF